MRLFEAILAANHRAASGDPSAGLRRDDVAASLPVVALTCIDPRLNPLMPEVLGIHEDDFIWLRNAGNIIFDPLSSMARTLALACAVKGGREIAIIGHTDCRVAQTSVMQLIDRFKDLGIGRAQLPDNLTEFFGLFASERQNVLRGVEIIRGSPLIGPRVPVHGLLVDIASGQLEWLVNGYQVLERTFAEPAPTFPGDQLGHATAASDVGEIPRTWGAIGEPETAPQAWLVVAPPPGSSAEVPASRPPLMNPPTPPRLEGPRPATPKPLFGRKAGH
jgi:carbonic anhydrase